MDLTFLFFPLEIHQLLQDKYTFMVMFLDLLRRQDQLFILYLIVILNLIIKRFFFKLQFNL